MWLYGFKKDLGKTHSNEGWMNAQAGDLLRYRKNINAEHISIFTDIKKKHSAHQITSDVSIGETASAASFFLSDGLIVTGSSTGAQVRLVMGSGSKSRVRVLLIGFGFIPSGFCRVRVIIVRFQKYGKFDPLIHFYCIFMN